MIFFGDESGDFAFRTAGFDCYVLVGLVCPEPELPAIKKYVDEAKSRLGVAELHGTALRGQELLQICGFISSLNVSAVAIVTDTVMMTPAVIANFRSKQLERMRAERAAWVESGANDPAVEQELRALEKAVEYTSRLSHPEFVQATLSVELLRDVIQRAIDRYSDNRWQGLFAGLEFMFDEKVPGRLSQGQKYVNAMYMRVLGSNPSFVLALPREWVESGHPFIANFTAEGVASPTRLFASGITTKSSKEEPGLQVADVIASVVRRSVLRVDPGSTVSSAFDLLRGVLSDPQGRCLQIYRYEGGSHGVPEIYRPLYALPGIRVGPAQDDRFRR